MVRFLLIALVVCFKLSLADEASLLTNPLDSLGTRVGSIRSAENEIFLNTFIWTEGKISRMMVRELAAALKKGIKVKLVLDALMLHQTSPGAREQISYLRELGAEVRVYNGFNWRNWANVIRPWKLAERAHDKIQLVDGKEIITGGRNLWDTAYELGEDKSTDIELLVRGEKSGKEVSDYAEKFWEVSHPWWALKSLSPEDFERIDKQFTGPDKELEVLYGSRGFKRGLTPELVDVGDEIRFLWDRRATKEKGPNHIEHLREWFSQFKPNSEVKFASPWFILSPEMKKAFTPLIEKSIRVQTILNSVENAEFFESFIAFMEHSWPYLVANDNMEAVLWEGKRRFHFKVMTDGDESYVGTYNFGFQSDRRNSETGFIIRSKEIAKQIEDKLNIYSLKATDLQSLDTEALNCASAMSKIKANFY